MIKQEFQERAGKVESVIMDAMPDEEYRVIALALSNLLWFYIAFWGDMEEEEDTAEAPEVDDGDLDVN